ncbi:hypothetical protein MMC13_008428 [Lambiella insularis]|nr:hypothetical protein [Lambiella insularis]
MAPAPPPALSSPDLHPQVQSFLKTFYQISDIPSAHSAYSRCFTEDAVLVMASKKAVGRSEILALRRSMWEEIKSRHHVPSKVFAPDEGRGEVMLYGNVEQGLKRGMKQEKEWAARGRLEGFERGVGGLRWTFYQVYMDTASVEPKQKKRVDRKIQ